MRHTILRYYRIFKHLFLFFKTGFYFHLLEIEHYFIMKSFSSIRKITTVIKFYFNYHYEKLHRYCFDYCYQSQNDSWTSYTQYKRANINNKLEPLNDIIAWLFTLITPIFKGWKFQIKSYNPLVKIYHRYEPKEINKY